MMEVWFYDQTSSNQFEKISVGKIRRRCQIDNDNADPPECSVHLPELSDLPSAGKGQCPSQPDVVLVTDEDCEFLICYAYLKNSVKRYVYGLVMSTLA